MDPWPAPLKPAPLAMDKRCVGCGYNLRGISPLGTCPECATPVQQSFRGNLLRHAAPDYLRALHTGVFLVQASVIVHLVSYLLVAGYVVVAIATGAGGGVARGAGPTPAWLVHLSAGLTILGLVVGVAGWWWFSEPDPAKAGEEEGATAQRVVRAAVGVASLIAGARAFAEAGNLQLPSPMPTDLPGLAMAVIVAIGLTACAVWYFAAMRYVRRVAARLPDVRVIERAKVMLWLGPVLVVFGCGIGWLIALVMYYNLLDWVRRDLKGIRAAQRVGR